MIGCCTFGFFGPQISSGLDCNSIILKFMFEMMKNLLRRDIKFYLPRIQASKKWPNSIVASNTAQRLAQLEAEASFISCLVIISVLILFRI
jgi:hypothetical protein